MNVFVARASEAVGRRMIPQLLAAGHAVVSVTGNAAKAESLGCTRAEPVVSDVFDAAAPPRRAAQG
jgi:uncharacterized protein YbjT (DUF2867 family)